MFLYNQKCNTEKKTFILNNSNKAILRLFYEAVFVAASYFKKKMIYRHISHCNIQITNKLIEIRFFKS